MEVQEQAESLRNRTLSSSYWSQLEQRIMRADTSEEQKSTFFQSEQEEEDISEHKEEAEFSEEVGKFRVDLSMKKRIFKVLEESLDPIRGASEYC